MSIWYKTGSISVTLGSDMVNGAGTGWIKNARPGDAFQGPDRGLYEVLNVVSDTALTITPPYAGPTAAGGTYCLVPVQGYTKRLTDQVADLINQFGDQAGVVAEAIATATETATNAAVTAAREGVQGVIDDLVVNLGAVAAAMTVDLSTGNTFTANLNAASCAITIQAGAMAGRITSFTLFLRQGSGANKVTWPPSVKWPYGVAPVLSYAQGAEDAFVLTSTDGGATWRGFFAGGGFR